jgi:hypothetical protein
MDRRIRRDVIAQVSPVDVDLHVFRRPRDSLRRGGQFVVELVAQLQAGQRFLLQAPLFFFIRGAMLIVGNETWALEGIEAAIRAFVRFAGGNGGEAGDSQVAGVRGAGKGERQGQCNGQFFHGIGCQFREAITLTLASTSFFSM